jgi:SAM-dependent methyltransferase
MARWSEGYVADVAYTTNIYRDMLPGWLRFASLLLGQRPPELAPPAGGPPFRYAELGCGFGLTVAAVAACHPEAEVFGFDFNPAHVEQARETAARAGLSNLRCEERSFAQAAAADDLPMFDMVALHGVWSWIAPEHRRQVVAFLQRRLKPGGLVYLSYNTMTGWASMLPVQALMRQLAERSGGVRSDELAPALTAFIGRLRQGGAAFFAVNPAVEKRLEMLGSLDARYVAHEYLNEHWQPQMSAEVAAELAEAKCVFIGSASLADNIDAASAPAGLLALLAEQRDPAMRETVRDFAGAQGFRRDLFRRGLNPMPQAEHLERLEALTLIGFGRRVTDEITFQSSIGQVTGKPEVYRPLLEALAEGPLSFSQARALPPFAGKPASELLQAVTLLAAGGYAHPSAPESSAASLAATRRLNLEIARANAAGGALAQLVAPAVGAAVPAELIETLVAGELLAGRAPAAGALSEAVLAALARTGRHVQAEGQPITDPERARESVGAIVASVLSDRVPALRRLGVLD